MKLAVYYLVCFAAVMVQITLLGGNISANIVLAAIVVSALYLRASDIAPIALICGLMLDIHAGTFFGLNTIFLVAAAMFAKFVLHLGERSSGYWNMVFTLVILEVLYLFIELALIFSADTLRQLFTVLSHDVWQVVLTLIAGSVLYAGSIWLQNYWGRGEIKQRWLRG